MKVIREGDRELARKKEERVLQFMCSVCGCIWEATKDEYNTTFNSYNQGYAECNCPTCGHKEYINI